MASERVWRVEEPEWVPECAACRKAVEKRGALCMFHGPYQEGYQDALNDRVAEARTEAVAEWREAVREDTPVEWGCSHCGMTRSVVIRFDEDGLAPASLNPSCPGYITCEAGGFSHPDDNSCAGPDGAIAWCPFDAADDYGTGDLEAVMAVRRERSRLRALLEASQEEGSR